MKRSLAWAWLGAVFALLYALSFLSWANPTIDGGREMNAPLRLLNGETLYADVYYLYGPLAPFLNATLYSALGIHLNTLYFAGTIAAIAAVVLVHRLGRALGGTSEALIAAWAVIVLCVFKQNGNYIFPYTYAAVYGTVLGLAALAALVDFVLRHRVRDLTYAGLFAGLALTCKLEFGLAALAAVLAAGLTETRGRRRRAVARGVALAFVVPIVAYGLLLVWIPWDAVIKDTFLWPLDIPDELLYFNRLKLGLQDPWKTVRELVSATALVGLLASAVVLGAGAWTARSATGALSAIAPRWRRTVLWLGGVSAAVFVASGVFFRTRWDVSPLRALPVAAALVIAGTAAGRLTSRDADGRRRAVFVLAVYSLVVLARVVLRVPSGGAYGAYLLPAPLLLFTLLATTYFRPMCVTSAPCAWRARRIVVSAMAIVLAAATAVIAYRYADDEDAVLHTPRGAIRLPAAEQAAYDAALALIAQRTAPGDYVWAVPEGSSLNFLADRRAPLRHEILTPGFLDVEGERSAIERLESREVALVFVLHRPMVEFGCAAFGRECYRELMAWIESNYRPIAAFGPRPDTPLIRAYARR